MADNYDNVLEQLRAGGLDVDSLEVGRLVRCPTVDDSGRRQRSGWYVLHQIQTQQAGVLLVGAWGNFREGVDPQSGKPISHRIEIRGRDVSPEERAAIRDRIMEDRRRAAADRARLAERAARRAAAVWQVLPPAPADNAYLRDKGVQSHGLRESEKGTLAVPIHDVDGRIHGLQLIYTDPDLIRRKGRAKDYWPYGVDKEGGLYLIGAPAHVVLVAEGYATAASLHEAVGLPVAVAFDAGGLRWVAKALRRRYRQARILICADDDFLLKCRQCKQVYEVAAGRCPACEAAAHHGNTGITAASGAALAVDGSYLAPAFDDRGQQKLTDWNDLHRTAGAHAVRAQIEAHLADLGWDAAGATPRRGAAGGDGAADGWCFDFQDLLDRYALIYGTETVFDGVRRRIVGLGALRAAAGKSRVRMWLEHPGRQTVLPDDVVFDPGADPGDESICNLWAGWPTSPREGSCDLLLELLEFLCSQEPAPRDVYEWVLQWLAYPIQHPGAKMQTSILMHGPEGTGKNTFFGAIRQIYGRYGGIFDQVQLESQFNGWASGRLFMIGNEVVTRVELYHQQGRLKNMITETEWQINEKNLPTRLEQNHCNFVFFSNRVDIAKLDPGDRRYCVIWTPPPLSEDFYHDVAAEIRAGGIAALHHHLLTLDLGAFGPHTKPPTTAAKRDLVEMSMDSTERFWVDWTTGQIPVPCTACRGDDLYQAYRVWAGREGLPKAAPANVLLAVVGKKPGVTKSRAWYYEGQTRVQRRVVIPPGVEPDPATSQMSWLSDQIGRVRNAIEDWREGAAT